jgi:hypothetical protein
MKRSSSQSAVLPEDVGPLLDDHHLVVLSDSPTVRQRFGRALSHYIQSQADTVVYEVDGSRAPDVPLFCAQLEQQIPQEKPSSKTPAAPWWRDVHHVIEMLSRAPHERRREYLIWHEADVMLEADVAMFSRLVNALLGSASEREHVSSQPLVLQRVIFIGGAKLGAYAEDSHGQFSRWLEDEDEADNTPMWEVYSVLDRPPVIVYRIDG